MKKNLYVLMAMLFTMISSAFADDKMYIADFEIKPGEKKEVDILLNNPDAQYRDLQFDLYLPAGITWMQDEYEDFLCENAARCTSNHNNAVSLIEANHYRCMLTSSKKAPLSGNSGAILTITLQASGSMAPGGYKGYFRQVMLSKVDGTGPTYPEFSFNITVKGAEQPVTVTAENKTMVYGENLPTLTYKVENGTLNGKPSLSTTAAKTSAVGTYPITVTRGTVTNTLVTFVDGTLTINKAPLTVGVQNVTITEGDPIPTFTLTYSGWKNSDTAERAFTAKPTASTTATSSSKAGTYDITVSGGTAKNYTMSYQKGTLTILKKDEPEPYDNTPLTQDMYKEWDGFNASATMVGDASWDAVELGTMSTAAATVYGNPSVPNTGYADVTGATTLRIIGTRGMRPRVLLNRQADDSYVELIDDISFDGYVDFDLSGYGYVHINAIKLTYDSPDGVITGMILNPTPSEDPTNATNLTRKMFHKWTLEEPVEILPDQPSCAYNLFNSTGMIYGDAGVNPNQFADLSEWDYLTIAATNGTPRLLFNRIYNPEAEEGTEEWKGANRLEINSTSSEYVESAENGLFVYDLKAIRENSNGMVRLHAIKGAGGDVTVYSLKLTVNVSDAIEDVVADDDTYQIYTIDGKPVETLQKGVNIIRYSDGQTKKVLVK